MVRTFQAPEDSEPDAMDAASNGEVLAVLDLRTDAGLLAAGLAREVILPQLNQDEVPPM